jgi:hypothetical protein
MVTPFPKAACLIEPREAAFEWDGRTGWVWELVEEDLVIQDMGLEREGRLPRWDLMDMDGSVGEVWGEGYSVRGIG